MFWFFSVSHILCKSVTAILQLLGWTTIAIRLLEERYFHFCYEAFHFGYVAFGTVVLGCGLCFASNFVLMCFLSLFSHLSVNFAFYCHCDVFDYFCTEFFSEWVLLINPFTTHNLLLFHRNWIALQNWIRLATLSRLV